MTELAGQVLLSGVGMFILLSLILSSLYPAYRKLLLSTDFVIAAHCQLVFSLLALIISIIATSLIFVPELSGVLVFDHCHETSCAPHKPDVFSYSLVGSALILLALAVVSLASWLVMRSILKTRRWLSQLDSVANRQARNAEKSQYQYKIVETNDVFAWCAGILKPQIYVSRGLIKQTNSNQLELILAHEQHHLENRDNLRKFTMKWATLFWLKKPQTQLLSDFSSNLESQSNRIVRQRTQQGSQEKTQSNTVKQSIFDDDLNPQAIVVNIALQTCLILLLVTCMISISHYGLEWLTT